MFRNSAFESVCSESEPSWHLVFFSSLKDFHFIFVKAYCTVLRGASQFRARCRETTSLPQKDASCLAGNTVWSIWSTNGILHRWYLWFGVMVVNVLKGLFEWLHLWKTNMEPFGTGGLWRCVSFAMWWHLFGLVVSFCLKHRNPGRVMKCYQQKRDLFIQQQGSTWWFLVRGAMLVRKQRTAVLPGTPLSLQTCRWIFVFEKTQFLSTIKMSSQTQFFQHSF